MFLEQIVKFKREEVESAKQKVPLAQLEKNFNRFKKKNFAETIKKSGRASLIAEIKQRSPSAGVLRENFSPVQIAEIYQRAGAAAISVLTDGKFFGGALEFVSRVKSKADLPVLRKEFIIDVYQIYESKSAGSDAILLIAELLTAGQLKDFLKKAGELELDALVEAHDADNLKKALEAGAEIVGINNRSLVDFKVDISLSEKLIPQIPEDRIKVSESGIKSAAEVIFLKNLGVDAVLIGETLMRAADITGKIKQIMSGAR